MFAIRCPRCHELQEVPNSLAGCRIRCSDCDGVLRAPALDENGLVVGEPTADGQEPEAQEINPELTELADVLAKQAEEMQKTPFFRGKVPIDLIAGIALVAGGMGWLLFSMLGGLGGLFFTLIFGILLSTALLLLGAICLMSWHNRK